MRKISIIICLCIAIFAGLYLFVFRSRADSITNYPSSGSTIVAFGDSLIKGYGSTKNHDFISDMSHDTGLKIINKGVSGETTADGLKRVDDILALDPKVVMILFGGNDFLKKIPEQETFANLEQMIQKIQAKGAVVMLIGVQGGVITDPYASQFKNLSEKYHTAYVPNILSGILGKKELMYDVVHPNDAGYALIAKRIQPILLKLVM